MDNEALIPFAATTILCVLVARECGCAAAQAGCAVINVADVACETFQVRMVDKDGNVITEEVPSDVLASAAKAYSAKKKEMSRAK